MSSPRKTPALMPHELDLVIEVFRRHPEIACVKLFGSCSEGTHTPRSDVNLAIWGEIDGIRVEAIAAELDELPMPYRFDVKLFDQIKLRSLREHIECVGIVVYAAPPTADNFPKGRTLAHALTVAGQLGLRK